MNRRKAPVSFTSSHVVEALRCCSAELAPHVARIRDTPGEHLFLLSYEVTQDREALHRYEALITKLLLMNPTGLFRKTTLVKGFPWLWKGLKELKGLRV